MGIPTDRVILQKQESALTGGDPADDDPFLWSNLDATEDAPEVHGVFFQPASGGKDETTIIYREGNQLSFVVGGATRAHIASDGVVSISGSLGVGTASPSSPVHLVGSTAGIYADRFAASDFLAFFVGRKAGGSVTSPTAVADGDSLVAFGGDGYDGSAYIQAAQIHIEVDGTPGTNDMPGRIIFQTTPDGSSLLTERMRITSAGNVGIATATASDKLTVSGTLRLLGSTSGYVALAPAAVAGSQTYTLPSADGTSGQVLSTNGGGTLSWASAGGSGDILNGGNTTGATVVIGTNDAQDLAFETGNVTRMYIDDTNGYVGIGTTSPLHRIHLVTTATNNSATLLADGIRADQYGPQHIGRKARGTPGSEAVVQNSDTLLTVEGRGYDGVSAYTTAAFITMEASDAGTFSATSMPGQIRFGTVPDGSTTLTERMRIDSDGRVGIGVPNPDFLLDVNQSVASTAVATRIHNSSATSGSDAYHYIQVNTATGGDPYTLYEVAGVGGWSVGLDNSDSDKFKIGYGAPPGAGTSLTIDTGGQVGIGTTTPGSELDVKGTLRLSGSTSGYVGLSVAAAAGSTTYVLPTADGSANQVLQTDGFGNLSWASAAVDTRNTLDGAYDEGGAGAGRTINATDGAVVIQNTEADTTNLLELDKSPSSSAAGNGLDITFGANATGRAISFSSSATNGSIGFFGDGSSVIQQLRYVDGIAAPSFGNAKARGTQASPAIVQDNDCLGVWYAQGYDGADYYIAADMQIEVDAVPAASSGIIRGRVIFNTADSSGVRQERLRIDKDGKIGVGGTPTTTLFEVISESEEAQLISRRASADAGAAGLIGQKSRGTVTSPADISAEDALLAITAQGYYSGSYYEAAQIVFHSAGTPGVSDMPGGIIFKVTPDGSASAAEAMRITSAGNIGIDTATADDKLTVSGTLRLLGSSSGYVALAPAATAGSTTYTLPSSDGSNGQVLQTDGFGVLSWASAAADTQNTLDEAYDEGGAGAGRTINATDGAVTISGTTNDTQSLLSLNRSPSSSAAAVGIDLTMGSNTTGTALSIIQNGSGDAINTTSGRVFFGGALLETSGEIVLPSNSNISWGGSGSGKALNHDGSALRFIPSGGVPTVRVNSTSVVIGEDNVASSTFAVSGNATIGTNYLGVSAPSAGLLISGSVGIGTISPTEKLTVAGDARIDQDVIIGGKLTVSGIIDPTGMVFDEQASVPGGAPGAAKGTIWVRNDSPNVIVFTDDDGTDFVLNEVAGTGDVSGPASSTNNSIPRFDGTTGKLIKDSPFLLASGTGEFSAGNSATLASGTAGLISHDFIGSTTTDSRIGIKSYTSNAGTDSNLTSKALTAVKGEALVGAINTVDWTNTVGIASFEASIDTLSGSTGTITGAAGLWVHDLNANGASVTNQYGLYIDALTAATNNYGLYINTPTGSTARAIHSTGGENVFGGKMSIGSTSSPGSNTLFVNGTTKLGGTASVNQQLSIINYAAPVLAFNNGSVQASISQAAGSISALGFSERLGVNVTLPAAHLGVQSITSTSGTPIYTAELTNVAHTNITAGAEVHTLRVAAGSVKTWLTDSGATGVTEQREVYFEPPVYAFDQAQTFTRASTISIVGTPAASTNAVITDSVGLLIGNASSGDITNQIGLYIQSMNDGDTNYGIYVEAPLGGGDSFHAVGGRVYAGGDLTTAGQGRFNNNLVIGGDTTVSGNVGIGNASPFYKLDIQVSSTNEGIQVDHTNANYIRLFPAAGQDGNPEIQSLGSDHLSFQINNNDYVLVLDGSKKVGINTRDPASVLTVSGIGETTPQLALLDHTASSVGAEILAAGGADTYIDLVEEESGTKLGLRLGYDGGTNKFSLGRVSNSTVSDVWVEVERESGDVRMNQDVIIGGKLTVSGIIDPTGMVFDEQSSVPDGAPGAAKGTIWVRDDSPNVLVFTDDTGTDNVLGQSLSGAATQRFRYTVSGTETPSLSDFMVTLPSTRSSDSYIVQGSLVTSASGIITMRFPDSAASDRTTTEFRVISSAPFATNDTIDFLVADTVDGDAISGLDSAYNKNRFIDADVGPVTISGTGTSTALVVSDGKIGVNVDTPKADFHVSYSHRISLNETGHSYHQEEMVEFNGITTWTTFRTITPNVTSNQATRGFIEMRAMGATNTVATGAKFSRWYFEVVSAAPTVGVVGTDVVSGPSAMDLRLNVSGNAIQMQVQSADASNSFYGTIALNIYAPFGQGSGITWTLS